MFHRFELGVEDLADTRFAISPLAETVYSLWAIHEPERHALHQPWLRSARGWLLDNDAYDLLLSVIGMTALPDFLTPRPEVFSPAIEDELAGVRATSAAIVRRDVISTFAPDPPPAVLRDAGAADDRRVFGLLEAICDVLQRYWNGVLAPVWPQMRMVLEADTTYRARRLAVGGPRALFSDMHPNVSWSEGVLHVSGLLRDRRTRAGGRGLLLIPSLFVPKPTPPLTPDDPPWLAYPSRGIANLWAPAPRSGSPALIKLLGRPRAELLELLEEPQSTGELARRLHVTPSAVSQHLQVLHATGLLTRARTGRRVLYRRTRIGDQLVMFGPSANRVPQRGS